MHVSREGNSNQAIIEGRGSSRTDSLCIEEDKQVTPLKRTRTLSVYEKYIKRVLDVLCSLTAIIVFSWLYIIIAILVRIMMGKPVIFKQPRPGLIGNDGYERIFDMYKFRTMTNEKDKDGRLLPDEARLGRFGKMLRATSLDELPEAYNILKGDMSVIGPRPQLVRDVVFMSDEQRMRHTAKPGLSGLAQVMGRNAITWEDKIKWDLKYIEKISFWGDLKIVFRTFNKVFIRKNMMNSSVEIDITDDFGDALLKAGKVTKLQYDILQANAVDILSEHKGRR